MNKLFTLHAAMMQVDGLIALTERKLRTLYELRLSLHHRLLTASAGTPCEDDAPCRDCVTAREHRRSTSCTDDAPCAQCLKNRELRNDLLRSALRTA